MSDLNSIMKIDLPIIVRICERKMKVDEVILCSPGSIIELPKDADDELDILVNNVVIGKGKALKISENYGVRLTFVGDLKKKIEALASATKAVADTKDVVDTDDAALLAEQMLSGQL